MITRRLVAPLDAALAAAQQAMLDTPDGTAGADEEEWILPAGDHAVTGPLALGRAGRSLALRGPGAAECSLALTGGAITLTGRGAIVEGVAVSGSEIASALELIAEQVRLTGARLACEGEEDSIALTVSTEGTAELEDVTIDGVRGEAVTGALIGAGDARVTGLTVRDLEGIDVTGVDLVCRSAELTDLTVEEVTGAGAVVGLELAGSTRIDLAGVNVRDLIGQGATATRVLLGRGRTGSVSVVDLEVTGIDGGAGAGTGLIAGAPGVLRVRGFSVAGVRGGSATGVLAVAGAGLELAIGQVAQVTGSAGSAAGVRVLATPSVEDVVVRDVAVDRVAAAPIPTYPRPARGAENESLWQVWAAQAIESLAGAVAGSLTLPPVPAAADVAGVHIDALVDELAPLLDEGVPGTIRLEDGSIRTVTGTAVQIDGGLRTALVRRIEAWTSVNGGWIQAEQVLLAELTWHRHHRGILFGPGEVRAYDSIFSAIGGDVFSLDEDTDLEQPQAVFATGTDPRLRELGPLPYVNPGPSDLPAELLTGTLPPFETVDLRLVAGAAVAGLAVPVPGDDDDAVAFVGAYAPSVEHRCELRDPQPRSFATPVGGHAPATMVDYRARDARSLLAVMLERARTSMAPWVDRGPADFTTMIMEALAERLDHLAYQQERAVTEGFLSDARLRRSVEDHVRALDYQPDRGLSASVMIRFRIDGGALDELVEERLDRLGLDELPPGTEKYEFLTQGGVLEIPADTLVANASAVEQSVVFATDEPLPWFPTLDELRLEEDVQPGDTSMRVVGVHERIEPGRWLVLYRGRGEPGHVVRATTVELAADSTLVGWDPRRPARGRFRAVKDPDSTEEPAVVLGNVVPAQHGLPLSRAEDDPAAQAQGTPSMLDPFEANLLPWQELLVPVIDGSTTRELRLPFHPASVQVPGYPFPGERRKGRPMLRVSVEDDVWTLADDLSLAGPGDEVYVLRPSPHGGDAIRFGDGVNGAALPARETTLQIEMRVGRGKVGNVGESVLARLLHVPKDDGRAGAVAEIWDRPMDELRKLIRVDNPLPGVGGREPEGIEQIRYRAPFGVSQPLSAVTVDDYIRLAMALPEVAGASARVLRLGVRHVVRVTVLLRDEDTLDTDERLRRWALVRSTLEGIRLLGFDVETRPPTWVPLDLDVVVDAHPYAQADLLKDAVENAVTGQSGLLDPDVSGLGGDVHLADLYQAITGVHGVAAARVLRFRRLTPGAPERLADGVIPIGPEEVATVRGPQRPEADGYLTVTVCGGLR